MSGVRIGLDCKLYRNTGTYDAPTWEEIQNARDVTLNMKAGEADASTRGGNGWKATLAALKDGSIEFEMIWDTTDDDFAAILAAFLARTSIDCAVMDDDITTVGAEGLRAEMAVIDCSRQEPLEDSVKATVVLKPTYSSNAPTWMTIAS